jgi:hypothetical protein
MPRVIVATAVARCLVAIRQARQQRDQLDRHRQTTPAGGVDQVDRGIAADAEEHGLA